METAIVFRIGLLSIISFLIAFFATPILTHFLFRQKFGKQIRDSKSAPIFSALHQKKSGTPTMGGVLIWGTVLFLSIFFYIINIFFPESFIGNLNFLTREQTLLPLGAMIIAAVIGLLDDYLNIKQIGPKGGGLSVLIKLGLYTIIATGGALWFYFKLDWDVFHIPFVGNFEIGLWYIPVFIIVIVSTAFSVNEIDGLDGLAGGTVATTLVALGAIAFAQGKFELATFIAIIVGALIAFLWFNINPARFFMGDTGSMSLGIIIGIIAMLTNTALLLPVIGFLFVIESLSVIIQLLSKKFRGKKVFLSAPIHHHFQAKGWSEPKIVMRFWLISSVTAVTGIMLFLADKGWY
jgi:phospho-N-acetylmuramoyl-pentapeptide-transferase